MSEVMQRVISGFVLVFMYIFAFNVDFYYNITLFGVLLLFCFLTTYEYISLTDRGEEGRPFTTVLYTAMTLIIVAAYANLVVAKAEPGSAPFGIDIAIWQKFSLNHNLSYGIIFITLILIFIRQIVTRPLMGAVFSLGATILGLTYIAYFGSHLLLLMSIPGGVFLIWYVSTINFMTDTAAYFGGRYFGRHPVGFKISPNKTYEGYLSGLVFATIAGYVVFLLFETYSDIPLPISGLEAILIGPFFSCLAVVGDLIESGIKRDARTKDSASLIPGHGGVFDLTDALFITVPSMYFYIVIRNFITG